MVAGVKVDEAVSPQAAMIGAGAGISLASLRRFWAVASNRNSKRRWRRTASRRHNAPKLRQVTILARENLTTLPRFVASLSRRAAKRPFPAVGLNVAEGWEAAIRSSRLYNASAPLHLTFATPKG